MKHPHDSKGLKTRYVKQRSDEKSLASCQDFEPLNLSIELPFDETETNRI